MKACKVMLVKKWVCIVLLFEIFEFFPIKNMAIFYCFIELPKKSQFFASHEVGVLIALFVMTYDRLCPARFSWASMFSNATVRHAVGAAAGCLWFGTSCSHALPREVARHAVCCVVHSGALGAPSVPMPPAAATASRRRVCTPMLRLFTDSPLCCRVLCSAGLLPLSRPPLPWRCL